MNLIVLVIVGIPSLGMLGVHFMMKRGDIETSNEAESLLESMKLNRDEGGVHLRHNQYLEKLREP